MKTVLCFSGGMDSTVLLAHLKNQGHEVYCISVDYGQRHVKELIASQLIAQHYNVRHEILELGAELMPILRGCGSSQIEGENVKVPEGHYAEESMKATVVPNRNMVLLSLATMWAVSLKADNVAYAAHAGDHAIYPDCRDEFAEAMAAAISLCDWHVVHLERPFIKMTKAEIAKLGAELNAPLHLAWSCYKGNEKHCGKCGTCNERRESFELAGVKDPTEYE